MRLNARIAEPPEADEEFEMNAMYAERKSLEEAKWEKFVLITSASLQGVENIDPVSPAIEEMKKKLIVNHLALPVGWRFSRAWWGGFTARRANSQTPVSDLSRWPHLAPQRIDRSTPGKTKNTYKNKNNKMSHKKRKEKYENERERCTKKMKDRAAPDESSNTDLETFARKKQKSWANTSSCFIGPFLSTALPAKAMTV